jgi:N-carbamoylputrescine amidase
MSATQPFTVGLIQEAITPDVATNLSDAIAKIREAHARGAQIVCLQELFNCQYFCKAQKGERFELAEPIPGPTVTTLQALAKDLEIVLIVPIFERQAAGVYRNSAAVIDADGSLLGVYRKMHIPDDPLFNEKFYFTPGDATQDERYTMKGASNGWRVWKTRYADIGVLICWDQWYPEGARLTALKGASILFYPTAIGWHPHEKQQYGPAQLQAWQTMQRSHAIANGVYVAAVNRVGHERLDPNAPGLEFWGSSFLCDPFGIVVAQAATDREEILVGEVDLDRMEEVRRNWPFLRDRRIDAYAGIDRRFLD